LSRIIGNRILYGERVPAILLILLFSEKEWLYSRYLEIWDWLVGQVFGNLGPNALQHCGGDKWDKTLTINA
jgi:hypothetical protein